MVVKSANRKEFQQKYIAEQLRVLADCVEEGAILDYEENLIASFDDIATKEFYFEVDAKRFHCLKNSICNTCGNDFYHASKDDLYCPKCEAE